MTQGIRQALAELQSQLAYHQGVAAQLSQAISNLRGLVGERGVKPDKGPKAKSTKAKSAKSNGAAAPAPRKLKAAAAGAGKGKKASLKRALQYVLEQHRKGKVPGASARQLFDDVQRAGFRFGGTNRENNMNYLYKTLRKNKIFKRVGDGIYGLA